MSGSLPDKLRVAVVGCGPIGNLHAQAMAGSPHAELVAVCDPNTERRQETAARFGASPYEDLASLLQVEKPDAVTIATPDHLHVEPALAAIAAGCHVFCEKPLALTTGESRRLVEAAGKRGVHLGVDFNRRFAFGYDTAKGMLDGGGIGVLKYCLLRVSDTTPPPEVARSPTVIFTTLLTHHFDLMRHYGGEVRSLMAIGGDEPPGGLLRSVTVTLKFASGALGTIVAGYRDDLDHTSEWMELGGTRGSIVVEEITRRVTIIHDASHNPDCDDDIGPENPRTEIAFEADAGSGEEKFYHSLGRHVQKFCECIARGEVPPVSGRDGLASLELAEAAIDSLARGTRVELPPRT